MYIQAFKCLLIRSTLNDGESLYCWHSAVKGQCAEIPVCELSVEVPEDSQVYSQEKLSVCNITPLRDLSLSLEI